MVITVIQLPTQQALGLLRERVMAAAGSPELQRIGTQTRPTRLRPRGRPGGCGPVGSDSASLLAFFSVLFLAPFVWLVSASLKTRPQVFDGNWVPNPPQFNNYVEVWNVAPILQWFMNSAIVSVLAAVTVTLSSALVAFAFAYFRFPFRNLLFGLVLASMMLPGAVTMVPTFPDLGTPRQGRPGDSASTR